MDDTCDGSDERYRIYLRRGRARLDLLATCPTPGSVGVALVQMHEDALEVGRRLDDAGQIGVLDGVTSKWVVLPFQKGTP